MRRSLAHHPPDTASKLQTDHGEGWGRILSLLCIGRLIGLCIRDRQKGSLHPRPRAKQRAVRQELRSKDSGHLNDD